MTPIAAQYGLMIDAPATAGVVRERVRAPIERAGLSLVLRTNPVDAVAELRQQSAEVAPVLLVIGPSVSRPVVVAQQLHRVAPLAPLLFLLNGNTTILTRQLASPVSMVGNDWQVLDLTSVQLGIQVEKAATVGRRRHRLRTTLDNFNVRLATQTPPDLSVLRRYTVSHGFLASILDNAQDAIIAANETGIIATWNRAAEQIFELSSETAVGRPLAWVAGGSWRDAITVMMQDARASVEGIPNRELMCERLDGQPLCLELGLSAVRTDTGHPFGLVAIIRNIEERKRLESDRASLERQMLRAEKAESLSTLAGGIAHDFNNLLTGVLGNAELALMDVVATSPLGRSLEEIRTSALRAAHLSRQMLAYSGRGWLALERVDLNAIIDDVMQLQWASLSKSVVVRKEFASDLPAIDVDVSQLRQVISNVITNSVEAIGDGEGAITIRTRVVELDDQSLTRECLEKDLEKGEYVAVRVSDTGPGMDEKTQQRMFDPFYTTKFTGRGLGLAAVQGIVRAHGGAVHASTGPGGTTFTMFFRISDSKAD